MSGETGLSVLRSRAQCDGTAVATSSGFRRTDENAASAHRTDSAALRIRTDTTIPGTAEATASPSKAAPITAQVVQALTSGKTPRMAAQDLGLPLDFVNLVIEQARISGDIDFFELRTENCTVGGACQPDPESMVCASCPILPPSIRKQQSPLGKLRRVISSHRLRKRQPAKV